MKTLTTILLASALALGGATAETIEFSVIKTPGSEILNMKVPNGTTASANGTTAYVNGPYYALAEGFPTLGCRGTDIFNVILNLFLKNDQVHLAALLNKRLNDGFCTVIPSNAELAVATSTEGAVCIENPTITPLPGNDRYLNSTCLWVRNIDLTFTFYQYPGGSFGPAPIQEPARTMLGPSAPGLPGPTTATRGSAAHAGADQEIENSWKRAVERNAKTQQALERLKENASAPEQVNETYSERLRRLRPGRTMIRVHRDAVVACPSVLDTRGYHRFLLPNGALPGPLLYHDSPRARAYRDDHKSSNIHYRGGWLYSRT